MIPRLYIKDLSTAGANQQQTLSPEHSHYLINVLKRAEGDVVKIFNQAMGEWETEIINSHKKKTVISFNKHLQSYQQEPDITLYFAPIKKTPIDYLVQKTTELGVQCLQPVITDYTIAQRINIKRLQANCIEAAEQTGRLSVPEIKEAIPLKKALLGNKPIIFCDEDNKSSPILDVLKQQEKQAWGILIGPEGGFSPAERDYLRNSAHLFPVHLGKRLLRADTAAIAALTCWQAVLGDWP